MWRLLRNRSLLTLAFAESVSGIGNWISTLALFTLLVFERNSDVSATAGLFLAALTPMLVFSPIAGWLCDRYDRKWLMIASELLSGVLIAALIFANQIWLMYVLVGLQSATSTIMTPARQSTLPTLVDSQDLSQANALLQQLAGFIKIGAPVLAGALLTVLDPHVAMILNVVSFGISALILLRLPALPPKKTATQTGSAPAVSIGQTFRSTPQLVLLFTLIFLITSTIIGVDALSSLVVRDILHSDASLYGLLIGLIGLGTVTSSVLIMFRKQQHVDPWRDIGLGLALLVLIPATLLGASFLTEEFGRLLVSAGMFLGGLGIGIAQVQSTTLLQKLTPVDVLGRVAGLYQMTAISGQMITLVALPLAVPALISIAAAFGIMTCAIIVLALFTFMTTSFKQLHASSMTS